ncbi:hypothetical protein KR059_009802 [Drosophila kikkawai]|nr:hypothetical protein KR059_009802 [Drosophila kikkawai]
MFKFLREMSVSKLSTSILVGIFRYFQLMGVVSFRLIHGEDGYKVCNEIWLKWTSAINRLLALCGFIYFVGQSTLAMQNPIMQVLHVIRIGLAFPSSFIIVGYQFFHGPEIIQLVNRFLRLIRHVKTLNKSKRSGFGGRREFVFILLKVTSLGHEVIYHWFITNEDYNLDFLLKWICNTYVISAYNILMHIYCLVFLSLGVLCSEVNEYARTDLAAQLEDLSPPISRRKRRKARFQLENCLALYREIYAVNIAFQKCFEIPIVVALTQKIMMVAVIGYSVITTSTFNGYRLWLIVGKHILDLLLLTLSVQGAVDQFKAIRRLNLEVYPVSDLPEFHTMVSYNGLPLRKVFDSKYYLCFLQLEIFFTYLNLYKFRVRIWGLCDISKELFIFYISALITWMVFIAQYSMQMKNIEKET